MSIAALALGWGVLAQAPVVVPEDTGRDAGLATLAAKVRPAVVALRAFDAGGRERGTATGFFITTDGVIATNVHVTEGARRIEATLTDGTTFPIEGLIAQDADRDVALIAATRPSPALALADDPYPPEGTRVFVVGSPNGLDGSVTDGIVSAVRRQGLPESLAWSGRRPQGAILQFSAPSMPGSSGSPLLDLQGRVVGIVQGGIEEGPGFGFAVPVEAIRALASRPRLVQPLAEQDRWRNLLISAAVLGPLGVGWLVLWLLRRRRAARIADSLSVVPRPRR